MPSLTSCGSFSQNTGLPALESKNLAIFSAEEMAKLIKTGQAIKIIEKLSHLGLRFLSATDGRCFSLARQIRALFTKGQSGSKTQPPLLAALGPLIPDQARLAFQSGFDLIEIDETAMARHGEVAWRMALSSSTSQGYAFGDPRVSAQDAYEGIPIWQVRLSVS